MSGSRVQNIIIFIFMFAVILFITIYAVSPQDVQNELLKETGKLLFQLIVLGVLGVYVKFLLDEYTADRQKKAEELERDREAREAKYRAQLSALDSLTTNYWEIKKAFHIIGAHRSAKSYGEQMRRIIDYRLKLQKLHNEINAGLYGLDQLDIKTIHENLEEMDTLLQQAMLEWKENYLRLSQLQKHDEEEDDPDKKQVPGKIENLPVLNQIKHNRFKVIHDLFMNAAQPIRDQILESHRGLQDASS